MQRSPPILAILYVEINQGMLDERQRNLYRIRRGGGDNAVKNREAHAIAVIDIGSREAARLSFPTSIPRVSNSLLPLPATARRRARAQARARRAPYSAKAAAVRECCMTLWYLCAIPEQVSKRVGIVF